MSGLRIRDPGLTLSMLRHLNGTGKVGAKTMEQLASGRRINRAADDAAGLAISELQTSQINGKIQADRNVLDGVSLLQTAEGGLSTITDLLQRARTLSLQAANDTLALTDRQAIQKEINQINADIERLATTVDFNGKPLLTEFNPGNQTKITTQADFEAGTVPPELDSTSTPGDLKLATEPYQVDAHHANAGNENYVSVAKIAVNPNGNQYDVTLELRFSDDSGTGGPTTFDGSITINKGNITAVGPLGGNEGGGGLVQVGNTVNFNIKEDGGSGNESTFTIDFTTTSLDASFTLDLNSPVDRGINRYFNNTLIQGGIPPGSVTQRFEPLETTGTYTSKIIDLGVDRRARIEFDNQRPTGTSLRYFVQTADDPSGPFTAPTEITNGAIFNSPSRYLRVLTQFDTPASFAANGIGPSLQEIRVTPLQDNDIIIQADANQGETILLNLPDVTTSTLALTDIDVTTRAGDTLFSQTITSQNDFEKGTLTNLNTLFTPGAIELDTLPFGTEPPPANNGQERLVSVNRQSSTANANGTVTTTVRVVSASDSTNPNDNPPPDPGPGNTEYIGRFSVIGGTLNDTDGDGVPDTNTVSPVSLEGYDPGKDGVPPFFHGQFGNFQDDLNNADPGSTVSADQFVDFRLRTGGLQDGFDVTLSGLPNMQFQLQLFSVQAYTTPFAPVGDAAYNVYFGAGNILATPTGAATITQSFEKRQLSGTYESQILDMGEGGLFQVDFSAVTPGNTGVTMEIRTSDDGINFTSYQAVADGGRITAPTENRYVQIRATLTGDAANRYISPQVNDITVARIASTDGPTAAIEKYTAAIDRVVEARAQIGAQENRLRSTRGNLGVMTERLSASRSNIVDLDFAEATIRFARTQVLQQAGTAALSQANLRNNLVLQLLGT